MSLSPRFYFDFTDPLSYVVEVALGALRPPPAPLTRSTDPWQAERLQEARRAAPELILDPPALVPWTRKALELHALAGARGLGERVRRAVYQAHFRERRDIGRIDELVAIAVAAGLDRLQARAALDVDAHAEDVLRARREAEGLGVGDVPALLIGGTVVQGFHNLGDVSTLLGGSPRGGR
jgi:predicted DsbA family dithiol-disulfide isomerase